MPLKQSKISTIYNKLIYAKRENPNYVDHYWFHRKQALDNETTLTAVIIERPVMNF